VGSGGKTDPCPAPRYDHYNTIPALFVPQFMEFPNPCSGAPMLGRMPVIVIGADSPLGATIADTLGGRSAERRAFVTAADAADRLRGAGFKVAVGDLSDWTHVEGAAVGAHTAVLVAEAASDGRKMAFAADAPAVVDSWVRAVSDAGVARVILVGAPRPAPPDVEWAVVDPDGMPPEDIATEVARLDEAARI